MSRQVLRVLSMLLIAVPAAGEGPRGCETLRSAPRFAVGHVGRAGAISREEAALHDLVSRPSASANLHKLLLEATLPGQLYALWGLAAAGDPDFPKVAEKYAAIDTPVETMSGCLVENEAASSIVKKIREGEYDKPARGPQSPANTRLQRTADACGAEGQNRVKPGSDAAAAEPTSR
jgi:hypothetical protein